MVSWLRPKRSAITFDLGAAGARAYQFRQRGSAPKLCDSLHVDRRASADLSEASAASAGAAGGETAGPGTAGPPAPGVDPVQIERFIGQGRFAGRTVGLVLSPPEVSFHPMRLPDQVLSQPPERFEQALRWEVARECRENPEELEVRYWRLPPGRLQHANVMAVVMQRSVALEWCALFERQGLDLARIDASPCALVRLARCAWVPQADELWGVLDLGLRHSTLTLVIGAVPTYIRTLSACAHEWTQRLATTFEVGYGVAEQLKREHGVQPAARGLSAGGAGRNPLQAADLPSACASVLREPMQALTSEVARCFSYVMQGFPDHAVKRLLLAGGGARLRGLPGLLEVELDIPVVRLETVADGQGLQWEQPLPNVRVEPHTAAALGGALLALEAS